jgi:hypothetical protein
MFLPGREEVLEKTGVRAIEKFVCWWLTSGDNMEVLHQKKRQCQHLLLGDKRTARNLSVGKEMCSRTED